MKTKDRVVIGILLLLALGAGLFAVRYFLQQAEEARAAFVQAAPLNGAGGAVSGEIAQSGTDEKSPADTSGDGSARTDDIGGAAGTGDAGGAGGISGAGGTAGVGGVASAGGASGAGGVAGSGGAAGTGGVVGTDGATGSGGYDGTVGTSGTGDTSGSDGTMEAGDLLSGLLAGNISDAVLLTELGLFDESQIPKLGEGSFTADDITQWMQNASVYALLAEENKKAAEAVAAGVNSGSDPVRRAFAQSQGEPNFKAEQNRLAEQATVLTSNYLRNASLLAHYGEEIKFYETLSETVKNKMGAYQTEESEKLLKEKEEALQKANEIKDEVQKLAEVQKLEAEILSIKGEMAQVAAALEILQTDLTNAEKLLEQAKLDQEKSTADFQKSKFDLNVALWNPATAVLELTGDITPLTIPAISEEEAVAAALKNRNELKDASYQIVKADQELTKLRYQFAPNSPEILDQQTKLETAKGDFSKKQREIEADIRAKYAALTIANQNIIKLTENAPPAEAPTYEVVKEEKSVTSNMNSILTQHQESSPLQKIIAVSQWNVDVGIFEHAMDVGVSVASIS